MEEKNNFQLVYQDKTPPKELKQNVQRNLTMLKFITSVLDLYTDKATKTITELLK